VKCSDAFHSQSDWQLGIVDYQKGCRRTLSYKRYQARIILLETRLYLWRALCRGCVRRESRSGTAVLFFVW